MKQQFYRVANKDTKQGLWYNYNGEFTGLIHNEFKFCMNNELQMPFDKEIVGFLSATKTLDELFNWFSKDDIIKLQNENWFIHEYEASIYKYYQNHYIICQETSLIKNIINI